MVEMERIEKEKKVEREEMLEKEGKMREKGEKVLEHEVYRTEYPKERRLKSAMREEKKKNRFGFDPSLKSISHCT